MSSVSIFYGIMDNRKDVTAICLSQLTYNNTITIPKGDANRSRFFKDHIFGTEKTVFVIMNGSESEYNKSYTIKINLNDSTIRAQSENDVNTKLSAIHDKISLRHGKFKDELPEQKMAMNYLTGSEKVLEIGGNIGRNSLIIASVVGSDNLITLESDTSIAKQLEENRNNNNFTFKIENSALSKRKLIQRGWNTEPSNVLKEGYIWVNTINYEELKLKYNIQFDTLVLDCEGAFYFILMDMPEILSNIKLIIMENDYSNISHKKYIDSILRENNFTNNYIEAGGCGCCYRMFFEVWTKMTV